MANEEEHFIGKYEVEQKFRVVELGAAQSRLVSLGAQPYILDNHEIDLYLDTKDREIAAKGLTLVLRNMQPIDRTLWIIKGPSRDDCIATRLPEYAKAQEMMELMGYTPYLTIAKQRDIYFFGKLHVTLDTVESLGSFVEVAVMTNDKNQLKDLEKNVYSVTRQLGLPDMDRVERSYQQLIEEL